MKNRSNRNARIVVTILSTSTLALVLAFALPARAQSSYTMPYHGTLTKGGVAANGSFRIQVRICKAAETGATCSWSETHEPVAVTNGRFSLLLGETNATLSTILQSSGASDTGQRFVEMSVQELNADGSNMDPQLIALQGRQLLGSAGYAWTGAPGQDFAVDGTLKVGKNASVAGTLTVGGNTTLNGDASVAGAATVTGDTTVGGVAHLNGGVDAASGTVTVNGTIRGATFGFGGMYQTNGGGCSVPNPITGGYNCPAGFHDTRVFTFSSTGGCSGFAPDVHICWK